MNKAKFTSIKKETLKKSFLPGMAYFSALTFQSFGIQSTTASNAGLISGTFIILVPIISWLLYRKKIKIRIILSILLAFTGIIILNLKFLDSHLQISAPNMGDLLIFGSTLSVALQIIFIERNSSGIDPILFSLFQFFWCIILSAGLAVVVPTPNFFLGSIQFEIWILLLIIGILGTGLPFMIQTWGQKHFNATTVSLIFATTPIFAAIVGIGIGNDPISWQLFLGGIIIIIATIIVINGEKKKKDHQSSK